MTYEEFKNIIFNEIKDDFNDNYTVKLRKVIKNNSITLDALNIIKSNESVTPNIYLNSYYKDYCSGKKIKEIILDIQNVYYMKKHTRENKDDYKVVFDWERMKPNITFRLINYNRNREALSLIPHEKFLDLAITYDYVVEILDDNIASVRITNQHLSDLNITIEELKENAYKNTSRLLPPHFCTMQSVLNSPIEFPYKKNNLISKIEDDFSELFKGMTRKDDFMFILTNFLGVNGAVCILYDGILEKIKEFFKTDIYIIPSSIHEVIIVPINHPLSKEDFDSMVNEVNESGVEPSEILSDHVYIYKSELNYY